MPEPLLEWHDDYLIGVAELDYEHRDLFRQLNTLHMELQVHEQQENIEACLGEIHTRIVSHFALEERFMREHATPGYIGHKQEHDDFLEVIVDVIEQYRSDPGPGRGENLEHRLRSWIIRHITTWDREMVGGRAGAG